MNANTAPASKTAKSDAIIAQHHNGSTEWAIVATGTAVSFLTGTTKNGSLARRTGTVARMEETPKGALLFRSYLVVEDETGETHKVNSGRIRVLNDQPTDDVEENEMPTAPQCAAPGCTRDAAFDGEAYDTGAGEGGYYSNCDRCSLSHQSSAGLHAHTHRFTPAQEKANGGPRSWITATTLRPVVDFDEITHWACSEKLPEDRGACGYSISAEDMAAWNAHRQEDMRLSRAAYSGTSNPSQRERVEEARAALETFRADWKAAHPEDIR